VPPELIDEGLDPEVKTAYENTIAKMEELGAKLQPIELPHFRYGIPAYYIVACAEASSNLARYDGIRYGLRADGFSDLRDLYRKTRSAGFGPEVKRRIMATPTAPTTAFKLGEKLDDPVQMYLADMFTVNANLAGIPAVSINCAFSDSGLPIGFQLLAPHLAEDRLLGAAAALEAALELPEHGPPIDEVLQ